MKRTIIEITCETDKENPDGLIISIENTNKEKDFENATQGLMKLLVHTIYKSQNNNMKMGEVKYCDRDGKECKCNSTRDSEVHQN